MLRIRLSRYGRKSLPFYRIVVIDSRKKRDGKFIESLGTYDPIKKNLSLNSELYLKHISYGAQPSEVVRNLFKHHTKKQSQELTK